MDLGLYGRVLWRFKVLVVSGILLAAFLALLSIAKITSHGLQYRKPVIWQSQTTLLLTQRGFPEGRALFPPAQPNKAYPFADTGRFASLTDLYSQFANSDEVRLLMIREGAPKTEAIGAAPVLPTSPIALFGKGTTADEALDATARGRAAFLQFVRSQQTQARIPAQDRVDIKVLSQATPPVVVLPRKKTLPIVVFIAVLSASIGLAFVLENLRPRMKPLPQVPAEDLQPAVDARRTA